MNDLKYNLECPICLTFFDKPRILRCGHSFCNNCLIVMFNNIEITCSLCNVKTITKSISILPINYSLNNITDSFRNIKKLKYIIKNNNDHDSDHHDYDDDDDDDDDDDENDEIKSIFKQNNKYIDKPNDRYNNCTSKFFYCCISSLHRDSYK
jgi:hypothetical protein